MRKTVVFTCIVILYLICSLALAQQPCTAVTSVSVQAAQADWDSRFVPMMSQASKPSTIASGFNVNAPGIYISCTTDKGTLVQYGSSLSPLDFWQLQHKGSRGKK